jgi:hypothetical protein
LEPRGKTPITRPASEGTPNTAITITTGKVATMRELQGEPTDREESASQRNAIEYKGMNTTPARGNIISTSSKSNATTTK